LIRVLSDLAALSKTCGGWEPAAPTLGTDSLWNGNESVKNHPKFSKRSHKPFVTINNAAIPDNLIEMLPDSTLIFGDGIAPYKEVFTPKELTILADEKLGIADAADVARLGMEMYEQGMRCEINALTPLYLRRSEAEERLKESVS